MPSQRQLGVRFLSTICFTILLPLYGFAADDNKTVSDYEARVAQYFKLRNKEVGNGPRPTSSPEQLSQTQQEMAAKVRVLRPHATQGLIFTPDIAAYLRKEIASTLEGINGAKIRASLRHAEPLTTMHLHVNDSYPDGVPLQSMPASLLLALPPLPDGLEYRLVGRNLILRDIAANLIVDYLPDAFAGEE